MNNTLPDNWLKDSFDKLLDVQPVLRSKNIIRPDVRASINMDSSCENTIQEIASVESSVAGEQVAEIEAVKSNLSSTPRGFRLKTKPFQCTLSPIGAWTIKYFDNTRKFENKKKGDMNAIKLIEKKKAAFCGAPSSNTLNKKSRIPTSEADNLKLRAMDHEKDPIILNPGKWRKSLSVWKRKQSVPDRCKGSGDFKANISFDAAPIICHRKSIFLTNKRNSRLPVEVDYRLRTLEICKQERPIDFDKLYMEERMFNSKKVGEGVFGEVFVYSKMKSKSSNSDSVLKVIPIEGSELINGEPQKTFELIIPEIIISQKLSDLRTNSKNRTCSFVNIQKVSCVKGKYPKHFLRLWEEYDNEKISENDNPIIFTNEQLYIVLEQSYAGLDLSSYQFVNAEQSYSILMQIIFALAVAEVAYKFEHRDLHWGNILILPTNAKTFQYKLHGKTIRISSQGLKATLIDYTLSRMSEENCCLYNDLSEDGELFEAEGDYQFEIYRMMKEVLQNKWDVFNPKTNVFWLSYVIDKMVNLVAYKDKTSKCHIDFMEKLKELGKQILDFKSAEDAAFYLHKV